MKSPLLRVPQFLRLRWRTKGHLIMNGMRFPPCSTVLGRLLLLSEACGRSGHIWPLQAAMSTLINRRAGLPSFVLGLLFFGGINFESWNRNDSILTDWFKHEFYFSTNNWDEKLKLDNVNSLHVPEKSAQLWHLLGASGTGSSQHHSALWLSVKKHTPRCSVDKKQLTRKNKWTKLTS